MSAPKRLVLVTYGAAFVGGDGRALAVVRGMERALPGLRLEWSVGESQRLVALSRRDEWLVAASLDKELPFLCNGDERHPVMLSGLTKPAGLSPGNQPLFEVHARLPLDAAGITTFAEVLEAVAEGAGAYWGHASPEGYGAEVSAQMRRSAHGPARSSRGLPLLNASRQLRSPVIPHYLGWLNYWSAASASAIGFPDSVLDAELVSRARRTESGGWVVTLTDAPLDYNDPAHLDALKRAYERFPEIGGRAAP